MSDMTSEVQPLGDLGVKAAWGEWWCTTRGRDVVVTWTVCVGAHYMQKNAKKYCLHASRVVVTLS